MSETRIPDGTLVRLKSTGVFECIRGEIGTVRRSKRTILGVGAYLYDVELVGFYRHGNPWHLYGNELEAL